jgi:hypothetical protein
MYNEPLPSTALSRPSETVGYEGSINFTQDHDVFPAMFQSSVASNISARNV